MCDNCGNQGLEQEENIDETIDDRLVELTIEKEYDRLSRRCLFSDADIEKSILTPEFLKGSSEALKLCGFYSTLVSFGVDEDKAWELTINAQNIEYNLAASEGANKTSLEIAKNQAVVMDKNIV